MKNLLGIVGAAWLSLLFSGCSEFLDKSDSVGIEADKVIFDFPATVADGDLGATESAPYKFKAVTALSIEDIGDHDVVELAESITSVFVESSRIYVTTEKGKRGYRIERLIIAADNVADSPQTIEPFVVGHDHIGTETERLFITELVERLVCHEIVNVTVEGYTNAPLHTHIDVKIESDILFSADPLYDKLPARRIH